jgi:hypothetical protein
VNNDKMLLEAPGLAGDPERESDYESSFRRDRYGVAGTGAGIACVCANPHKDAPVVVGHYHLNVTSVEEHKKFWVDTLGGTAIKFGSEGVDVIRFPGVFLFLRKQPPAGPSRGTTLDHIGFAGPDVPKMTTRVVANGYGLTVGRDPAPGQTDYFIGADLPGVGYMLNFFSWLPDQILVGTKGRAIDHVGFEVKNLQESTKRLEAKGIKLTEPHRRVPALDNMGIAGITDPWGTSIELTEGLRDLP